MKNDSIDFILDNYKGVRRDRALKITTGQLKSKDSEFKHFLLNELVRYRHDVIRCFKMIDELTEYRKVHNENYKYFQKQGYIVQAAETYLNITEIDNLISDIEENIATYGEYFIDILRFDILTEHEICQIFNINYKTWQDKKCSYINLFGKDKKHFNFKILSICGVEYRHRKGRAKEMFDCPDFEMPIYWAIHTSIMKKMEDNEEFRTATMEEFKKLFPGIKTYKVVEDQEGNIVNLIENIEDER